MKILLLAGEESGLIYAHALQARLAGHDVRGYGDYGFRTADLAVVGVWAVLKRIGYFLRVARTMKRAIDEWRPDVVLTIDYPGMNLKLAAYAKGKGIRAVHVVCPQVWAWKQGRIPKIERSLDALCCFFPFETKLFKPGFATFVGHPLVQDFERTRDARRETRGRETGDARRETGEARRETGGCGAMMALLPGSRKTEIARNLPPLLEAARIVAASHPSVRFVIPAVHAAAKAEIAGILLKNGLFAEKIAFHGQETGVCPHKKQGSVPQETGFCPLKEAGVCPQIEVRLGGAREALLDATCAAVASGTATLEAALAKCPTVLVYRVSAALAWLARRVIKGTRFLGLANILWDRCVGTDPVPVPAVGTDPASAVGTDPVPPMPELLQEDFTPEAVASRLVRWLDDPTARAASVRRLTAATDLLCAAAGDPLARILEVAI